MNRAEETTTRASLWDTPRARALAAEIASLTTAGKLYCGPAVVGWIAAVWNESRGRSYDVAARLADKGLFRNGPRLLRKKLPLLPGSIDAALRRETKGDLGLAPRTRRRYRAALSDIEQGGMPLVVCLYAGRPFGQWHYTAIHRAETTKDTVQWHWMDNGLFGRRTDGNPGLFTTGRLGLRRGLFVYGATPVVRLD